MTERKNFGSRLGIVLATAGSAVGLGNIWRFPTMAGANGGAAFILIYIMCVLLLGIPGMLAEFAVGRRAQTNAPRAYRTLGGKTPFAAIGYVGTFSCMVIFGFYSVVAGWCVHYFIAALSGDLLGTTEDVVEHFSVFTADPWQPLVWTALFMSLTLAVVIGGVNKGIERCSKTLMPLLFIVLCVIVIASLCVPEAHKGIEFLFAPDFSKVRPETFLAALGQAFFSLSLGVACLTTYASYFDKSVNLTQAAVQIAVIDSAIAILAGLMIFPAALSVGVHPDAGPSLVFITLPNVFNQAFSFFPLLGEVISPLFFSLLLLAALTSTISMLEVGTAFIVEEFRLSRGKSAAALTLGCFVIATLSSLSFGVLSDVTLFGKGFFDFFDYLTGEILLPLTALLIVLLVGWYLPRTDIYDELTNHGTIARNAFPILFFAIRYICPLGIIIVFLSL